jgi:hypothetical protein
VNLLPFADPGLLLLLTVVIHGTQTVASLNSFCILTLWLGEIRCSGIVKTKAWSPSILFLRFFDEAHNVGHLSLR